MPFLSDRYAFKRWTKRLAVFLFDSAGSFLFFFLKRSKPLRMDGIKRVLFIRIDQIGDIALMVPAARAFKNRFPAVSLELLTSPEGTVLLEKESGLITVAQIASDIFLLPFHLSFFCRHVESLNLWGIWEFFHSQSYYPMLSVPISKPSPPAGWPPASSDLYKSRPRYRRA